MNTRNLESDTTPPPAAEQRRRVHAEPDNLPVVFVSIRQASRIIGISAPTVYVLIRDGKLRCKRIGRHSKIPLADVAALVDVLPDHPLCPDAAGA